jgi:hypothetical protein
MPRQTQLAAAAAITTNMNGIAKIKVDYGVIQE